MQERACQCHENSCEQPEIAGAGRHISLRIAGRAHRDDRGDQTQTKTNGPLRRCGSPFRRLKLSLCFVSFMYLSQTSRMWFNYWAVSFLFRLANLLLNTAKPAAIGCCVNDIPAKMASARSRLESASALLPCSIGNFLLVDRQILSGAQSYRKSIARFGRYRQRHFAGGSAHALRDLLDCGTIDSDAADGGDAIASMNTGKISRRSMGDALDDQWFLRRDNHGPHQFFAFIRGANDDAGERFVYGVFESQTGYCFVGNSESREQLFAANRRCQGILCSAATVPSCINESGDCPVVLQSDADDDLSQLGLTKR